MSSSKTGSGNAVRGRPRNFDNASALEAAMVTFWRQGYMATSLDDLVAATGASRASLYKVYGDKQALFLRCLELYGDRFEARVDSALAEAPTGLEAVRRLMTASAERLTGDTAPAGCLRCNSTLELMGSAASLDRVLIEANERFRLQFRRVVQSGIDDGSIRINQNGADRLATFLTGTINGMVTLARGGVSRADLMVCVESALGAIGLGAPDPRAKPRNA